jgi:hypothetical protein
VTREELRAITAQGPTVVQAEGASLVRLLDELAELTMENSLLRQQRAIALIFAAGSATLWLAFIALQIING